MHFEKQDEDWDNDGFTDSREKSRGRGAARGRPTTRGGRGQRSNADRDQFDGEGGGGGRGVCSYYDAFLKYINKHKNIGKYKLIILYNKLIQNNLSKKNIDKNIKNNNKKRIYL